MSLCIAEDRLHKLPKGGAEYGDKSEERLFNVALELCITWINRILFLKLLEGQLMTYHSGDKNYRFLDFKTISNYDELNKLFFQVLARKEIERTDAIREKFARVPYLNSSLFDISGLEDDTIRINSLDDGWKLRISGSTVLKTENGKKREGEIPALQYLFEFLDAYDFSSEGKEEIQEENKTLINASVLGLIFEKINGYKDGSFFTPGFITMYMCRETIRRAVVQKFNEAKKWKLEEFEQLYNKVDDIKEANDIINSLRICDPAVGSGHFLVSALNEIIAIKSELGILTDRQGNVLRDYAVEVVNDELIVSTGHNEFFEYKPGNKESQRVQQALFHEKQTLIENCLFGVDINPNSVKICRLRLWIELLKDAYYTSESKYAELETLPNIDINIKQGNSLVSRFSLDADLSKALRSIKYTIDDYRAFVNHYKNATDKEEKRGFEKLIEQIKKDFRTEIAKNDPKVALMSKRSGELYNLLNQARVFEPTKKEKKEQLKKKEKLEADINKLAREIEEIKSSAIYKDAFEWRFEFPEVVDNDGNFIGFDVVIGNPPYVFARENFDHGLKNYFYANYKGIDYQINLFVLFIERSLLILNTSGNYSLIVPNSLLMVSSTRKIRELLSNQSSIHEIVNFIGVSFEGVNVETVTVIGNKGVQDPNIKISIAENGKILFSHTKESKSIVDSSDFALNVFSDSKADRLITKVQKGSIELDELVEIRAGLQAYEVGKGSPKQTRENVTNRIYDYDHAHDVHTFPYVEGKDVQRYIVGPNSSFLKYGDNLAAPRTFDIFSRPKIIVREITGKHPKSLICGYSEEVMLFNRSNIAINERVGKNISLKYILALLNSCLMSYYFKVNTAKAVRQMFPKIILEDLRKFPIKAIAMESQQDFISLVDQMVKEKKEDPAADTSELEKELDQLVYQLYGLTEEEIKIVEHT
jgi:adenine-specific DNA-methyltransferase